MGTKFSITGHAVDKHAKNLETTRADMNAHLSQFVEAVSALPGSWKGSSFTSFNALQERWATLTKDLNSALDTIQSQVGGAAQIYDRGLQEQTAQLNQVAQSANWSGARAR